MTMRAWAFLVSRNQSVDYKTIVAPDFIDAAKLRSLLTKVTEGDLTPPGKANIRLIQSSAAGNFSIVFRLIKAKASDIGEFGGSILKDSFGRDIYLVEGLVFQEDPDYLWERIDSSYLEQAHAKVQGHFQHFWYTDETAVSQRLSLQQETFSQFLKLEELETIVVPTKSRDRENKKDLAVIKSSPKPMKFQPDRLSIMLTTAIVLIILSLLVGQLFNGGNILGRQPHNDCTYVTSVKSLPPSSYKDKDLPGILEDLNQKNKPASLFISTIDPAQLPITQRVQVNQNGTLSSQDQEEFTFQQEEGGRIKMEFHPLQQAVMQFRGDSLKKLPPNTTLEVRIIKPKNSKDQCLQRLRTL